MEQFPPTEQELKDLNWHQHLEIDRLRQGIKEAALRLSALIESTECHDFMIAEVAHKLESLIKP